MSDKFPQTSRNDISPEKNPTAKKNKGESYNEAMNPPNDPQKRYRPTAYNVTDDYCGHDTDSEPDSDSDDSDY